MNQKTGLKRNLNDKYYTSIDTVKLCMNLFKSSVNSFTVSSLT